MECSTAITGPSPNRIEGSLDNVSFGKHFKNFEYQFDPETGSLRVAWDTLKIATKRAGEYSLITGYVVGTLAAFWGGVLAVATKNPSYFYRGALWGSASGSAGGAAVGFVVGSVEAVVYVRDLRVLEGASRESAEKAKRIFNALMQKKLQKAHEEDSIFCPISHQIFSFPVEAECKHVFDYEGIREWLERAQEKTCPLCKRSIELRNFQYREDIDIRVAECVQAIFECISKIVKEHTLRYEAKEYLLFGERRFYCQNNHLESREALKKACEDIRENGSLSRKEVDEIVERIDSNTLSEKDGYILSTLLAKSVENFQNKIDKIFAKVRREFFEMSERNEISNAVYCTEMGHLIRWHTALSMKE